MRDTRHENIITTCNLYQIKLKRLIRMNQILKVKNKKIYKSKKTKKKNNNLSKSRLMARATP
jgi:hypothetical protein